METSKEMQLKIIDKMRENIDRERYLYLDIQRLDGSGEWQNDIGFITDFEFSEYRIKPQTITINGVEIPKPLTYSEMIGDVTYYCVDNSEFLHKQRKGQAIINQGVMFAYETKEEAITSSKALFGIE